MAEKVKVKDAYCTLVLCKHEMSNKIYLFRAPWTSLLSAGDEVVVNTKYGEKYATVINACATRVGSDEYWCLIDACGAEVPLATVKAKLIFSEFDYGEEEQE